MDNGKRPGDGSLPRRVAGLRFGDQVDDPEETIKQLRIRIEELKGELQDQEVNILTLEIDNRKLQGLVDAGPLIREEEYLREVERQTRIATHAIERMKDRGSDMRCSWCGNIARAKKISIWWNEYTGEILMLHLRFCMKFPEPFRDTKAGSRGWHRIDPWQHVKGTRPRLRKEVREKLKIVIAEAPSKQTKLGS